MNYLTVVVKHKFYLLRSTVLTELVYVFFLLVNGEKLVYNVLWVIFTVIAFLMQYCYLCFVEFCVLLAYTIYLHGIDNICST